jgi:PAS domain S-box-containing protein
MKTAFPDIALVRSHLSASRAVLISAGSWLCEAALGQELLRRIPESGSLVLLPAVLPDVDAADVCSRMRAFSRSVRLVLVGPGEAGWQVRGLEAGADACIPDGSDLRLLEAQVRALLRRPDEAPHRTCGAGAPAPALAEIIDVASIRSLMEDFYSLTRVPMSIIDLDGEVLVGVGWQDVCTNFHRVNPLTCRYCRESDSQLPGGLGPGEFRLYKCKNNMWDVATPIMIGERHVANVFSGQFFFDDESVDDRLFRRQARQHGFDEEAYMAAIDRVPRLSREVVETAMAFFVKLAQVVSRLGQANLTLASAMAEREALMESLSENRADLARAQAVARTGSWRMNVRQNVLTWSDETYRIFGVAPGKTLCYEMFLTCVHPSDRALVDAAWQAALAGSVYDVEHRITVDGKVRWVRELAELEFDASGVLLGAFGTVQDITERKRAEEALREADRRKNDFIAVLSHELRNPLAPIRYALPVIQQQRLNDQAARAVNVIDRQVAQLTRLVNDLLDVSRITHGKIELHREHVTLGSIVTAAAEGASPAIAAARHTFRMVVAEEPVWLNADAARLSQVVTNLLNNSAKYTPRGGEIALEAGAEGDEAVIRVRDTGMGIPEQSLATVFEMFKQVGRLHMSDGGLGIGLGLARTLVEMHGGTITAHSAGSGNGAEFEVRLPVAREGALPEVADSTQAPAHRRLRVLIVDDNADLVEMLAVLVAGLGHDVRKALDGRSAVSAAMAYRPDVVLLDLGLPVMSGIEVARELRRFPEMAAVRLVALTGWGQAEDRQRTAEAGFDRHLTKPTDPETLKALLAELAEGGPPAAYAPF